MDFDCFFDELQKMETHLGDWIDGHHRGLESRTEDHFFTTEYATDGGPLFDEEPDQEGPLFDEEDKVPLFAMELGNLTTACLSAVFDKEPDDLTSACFGFDEDPFLDEGPLFDKEPDHGEEESSTHTELVLGSIIATAATTTVDVMFNDTTVDTPFKCSTKFPDLADNVTMPVQVYTITQEAVLELDLAAVAPMVIADVPNNVSTVTSSTCSTKCASRVVDIILVSDLSICWIGFPVVLERGDDASVVNSWFSVEWVEPWSPHMQLKNEQGGGVTRPDPWPSLCLHEVEEHPRYRSMCPTSNSELVFMLSRKSAPSNATTLQKCSGASKLAWHKGSFMVFWCWQLIQMEFWCSLHFQLNIIRWSRDEEWQTISHATNFGWMQLAEPVMNHYTEATDGSYVETKETALVWQHQDADKVFGSAQAKELCDHLNNVLTNEQVSVKSDQFIVEVKPQGVSKGLVAEKILTLMKEKGRQTNFVLCIGDDRSDEDMFENIAAIMTRSIVAPKSPLFACTVGQKPSKARFYLDDTDEVVTMLSSLADASKPKHVEELEDDLVTSVSSIDISNEPLLHLSHFQLNIRSEASALLKFLECLMAISVSGSVGCAAISILDICSRTPIIVPAQRKCGGYYWSSLLEMCQLKVIGKYPDCQEFASAQLHFSVSYCCGGITYL